MSKPITIHAKDLNEMQIRVLGINFGKVKLQTLIYVDNKKILDQKFTVRAGDMVSIGPLLKDDD